MNIPMEILDITQIDTQAPNYHRATVAHKITVALASELPEYPTNYGLVISQVEVRECIERILSYVEVNTNTES